MGKGDSRTRRGKIFRGTFGKSRPKRNNNNNKKKNQPTQEAAQG